MPLSPEEARVLACLVEKEATVPDAYPLTLNALRLACNQTSSRHPVVAYDDRIVEQALMALKSIGLVRFVHPSQGGRTIRYRHVADERWRLDATSSPCSPCSCSTVRRPPGKSGPAPSGWSTPTAPASRTRSTHWRAAAPNRSPSDWSATPVNRGALGPLPRRRAGHGGDGPPDATGSITRSTPDRRPAATCLRDRCPPRPARPARVPVGCGVRAGARTPRGRRRFGELNGRWASDDCPNGDQVSGWAPVADRSSAACSCSSAPGRLRAVGEDVAEV